MARKLILEIVGDTRGLQRSFRSAERSADQFARKSERIGTRLSRRGMFAGGATSAMLFSGHVDDAADTVLRRFGVSSDASRAITDFGLTLGDLAIQSGALNRPLRLLGRQVDTLGTKLKLARLQGLSLRSSLLLLGRLSPLTIPITIELMRDFKDVKAAWHGVTELAGDIAAGRLSKAFGGKPGLTAEQWRRIEAARARPTETTINVNGVTDPAEVARRVAEIMARRGRHSTTQVRGPATGY